MTPEELKTKIEELYNSYFPDSIIQVDTKGNLYRSIYIAHLIAKDKSEVFNGILDNDILHFRLSIDSEGRQLPPDYKERLPFCLQLHAHHKNYHVKPTKKYYAYDRRIITFRTCKGDADKILKYLDKVYANLKKSLLEDYEAGNISDSHIESVKRVLGK